VRCLEVDDVSALGSESCGSGAWLAKGSGAVRVRATSGRYGIGRGYGGDVGCKLAGRLQAQGQQGGGLASDDLGGDKVGIVLVLSLGRDGLRTDIVVGDGRESA